MIDRTESYFDDLVERAIAAQAIPRQPWSEAQPNACHSNCEAFIRRFAGYELVRGWLAFNRCWFVPHSVVREVPSGKLIDITPEPGESGAIPFVEHRGTEEDFALLRKGRDGGWLHPQSADVLACGNDSDSSESTPPEEDFDQMSYTIPTQAF